jgi:mannose-6-phosphate isomerase
VADANAKPEMIVAITKCEALIGFRPLREVAGIIAHIVPFAELLGGEVAGAIFKFCAAGKLPRRNAGDDSDQQAEALVLRQALETLSLRRDKEAVAEASKKVQAMVNVDLQLKVPGVAAEAINLARRIGCEHAEDDLGVFLALLMNFVELAPGEAVFIPAGVMHAYVSGGLFNSPFHHSLPMP